MTKKVNDQEIIDACLNSSTMSEACSKLDLHLNTFMRHARRLGVYKPNQGGKGTVKNRVEGVIPLSEILQGLHPSYQTFKLKHRLIKEGIKKNECECCGVSRWMNKDIACELDHIDGNSNNHVLNNLRILCPNCHSQTSTFRSKKR